METTLVLTNEGQSFEQMYYRAVCMGELQDSERLYEQYTKAPVPFFWRDAFRASGFQDTVLMSVIINMLDMPFGSYVFTCLTDERIEIAPWLYGEDASRNALIDALNKETADSEALYAYSRTLHLTADFLVWLQNYNKKRTADKEA